MKLRKRTTQITSGYLKDRCTLLQPTSTANGRGGFTVTYASYGDVWCMAEPASNARELVDGRLTFYDAFHFTIRVSEVPILANWHITFGGRTYTIHTIDNIENRFQYYKILAYSAKL